MQNLPEENLLSRITSLEEQVELIHQRNRRVEIHKLWETSRTRLFSLTVVTYITMTLVLSMMGSLRPLLEAFVPTAGFFLSTLSLPFIRKFWEQKVQ